MTAFNNNNNNISIINALEFYAGIGLHYFNPLSHCIRAYYLPSGGLHRALNYSSIHARVIAAYDWDPAARQVYDHNYPKGIFKRVRTHNNTIHIPHTT